MKTQFLISMLLFAGIYLAMILVASKFVFKQKLWTDNFWVIFIVMFLGGMGIAYFVGVYSQGADIQILNGQVVSKERDRVSCSHSYECNCVTNCTNDGCSTSCSTCYEHSFDYDWLVHTSVGSLEIPRIDRQGAKEPPRWTSVIVGEPASIQERYFNYVKGNRGSLFHTTDTNLSYPTPQYPVRIYDHYRAKRVAYIGTSFRLPELDSLLNDGLRTLGPSKKVNIAVVFHDKPADFVQHVQVAHLGGKINDLYVLISVDKDGVIDNVGVFSWSKSDMVHLTIRDLLLDLKTIDNAEEVSSIILSEVGKHYQARSIEEFEYLGEGIVMPMSVIIAMLVFSIGVPFILGYLIVNHTSQRLRNWRRR